MNIETGKRVWRNPAGQLHREDGPARELPNGTNIWYLNGERHRSNGPAIERFDGDKEWWLNNRTTSKQEISQKNIAGLFVNFAALPDCQPLLRGNGCQVRLITVYCTCNLLSK
jgi:hypothetical protein